MTNTPHQDPRRRAPVPSSRRRFDIEGQSAENINNVQGDQNQYSSYTDESTNYYGDASLYALSQTRGGARFVVGLGMLIFFAGFASFGYVVVSFIVQIFSMIQTETPGPPDVAFMPWLPLGIGLGFLGMVIMSIGSFFSRRREGGRRR